MDTILQGADAPPKHSIKNIEAHTMGNTVMQFGQARHCTIRRPSCKRRAICGGRRAAAVADSSELSWRESKSIVQERIGVVNLFWSPTAQPNECGMTVNDGLVALKEVAKMQGNTFDMQGVLNAIATMKRKQGER